MKYLILVLLFTALAGCHSAGLKDQLVGKWVNTRNPASTAEFFPTGDVTTTTNGSGEPITGTFQVVDNSHIKVTPPPPSPAAPTIAEVRVKGDQMEMTLTGHPTVHHYKRVQS